MWVEKCLTKVVIGLIPIWDLKRMENLLCSVRMTDWRPCRGTSSNEWWGKDFTNTEFLYTLTIFSVVAESGLIESNTPKYPYQVIF